MGSLIEKYQSKIDRLWVGLVVGLIGLFLGFLLVGIAWGILESESLSFFIKVAFIEAPMYRVRILTASGILDVMIFFYAFQKGLLNFSKGILGVLILAILAIAILY